jgi:hypothetical protein
VKKVTLPILTESEQDGAAFAHSVFRTENQIKAFAEDFNQSFLTWAEFLKKKL